MPARREYPSKPPVYNARHAYETWFRWMRVAGTTASDYRGEPARRNAALSYWYERDIVRGWKSWERCRQFCGRYYSLTGKIHPSDPIPF